MSSVSSKAKLTKSAYPRPPSTRQRIVTQAITLFNRYGIQNVAIERIASDLKISPGNLTYHFKRKDDLIRAALDVLKDNLRVALERPVTVTSPRSGAEYLIRMYRVLWDYRFFFNSLAFLLQDDRQLRKEYAELHRWVIDILVQDLNYLLALGVFKPVVPPDNFRLLAENIWAHILNWLRMQQIETSSAATPSNQAIYDAALHLWSLSHLWLDPAHAQGLLQVLQELLAPEQLKASTVMVPRKRKAGGNTAGSPLTAGSSARPNGRRGPR